MSDEPALPIIFDSEVFKSMPPGGWTYLVWPQSVATFGTRGLVKVVGRMDVEAFDGSFMAMGDGTHKLPVTARMLKRLAKAPGNGIPVELTGRRV